MDENGLRWRKYLRRIRLIGQRKNNKVVRELPENLMGKIVDQQVWLCVSEGYEWHFIDSRTRPILITLDEKEVEVLKG